MMNNKIKNAFDKVRAEDELKRNTKDFLSARGKNRQPPAIPKNGGRVCLPCACDAELGGWRFI